MCISSWSGTPLKLSRIKWWRCCRCSRTGYATPTVPLILSFTTSWAVRDTSRHNFQLWRINFYSVPVFLSAHHKQVNSDVSSSMHWTNVAVAVRIRVVSKTGPCTTVHRRRDSTTSVPVLGATTNCRVCGTLRDNRHCRRRSSRTATIRGQRSNYSIWVNLEEQQQEEEVATGQRMDWVWTVMEPMIRWHSIRVRIWVIGRTIITWMYE